MKYFLLSLGFLFSFPSFAQNQQQACAEQIQRFCNGSFDQNCKQQFSQWANRLTRDMILDFDGTACANSFRNQRPSYGLCDHVVNTVISSLAVCWNQYARGCVSTVGNRYRADLRSVARLNCSVKLEFSCREECYPRFPSDCNRSCANLAAFAR